MGIEVVQGLADQCKSFGFYSEVRSHWRGARRGATQPDLYFSGITLAVRLRVDRRREGDQCGGYCSEPGKKRWRLGQESSHRSAEK